MCHLFNFFANNSTYLLNIGTVVCGKKKKSTVPTIPAEASIPLTLAPLAIASVYSSNDIVY